MLGASKLCVTSTIFDDCGRLYLSAFFIELFLLFGFDDREDFVDLTPPRFAAFLGVSVVLLLLDTNDMSFSFISSISSSNSSSSSSSEKPSLAAATLSSWKFRDFDASMI